MTDQSRTGTPRSMATRWVEQLPYRPATRAEEETLLSQGIDKAGVNPDQYDLKFFVNQATGKIDRGVLIDHRQGEVVAFDLLAGAADGFKVWARIQPSDQMMTNLHYINN